MIFLFLVDQSGSCYRCTFPIGNCQYSKYDCLDNCPDDRKDCINGVETGSGGAGIHINEFLIALISPVGSLVFVAAILMMMAGMGVVFLVIVASVMGKMPSSVGKTSSSVGKASKLVTNNDLKIVNVQGQKSTTTVTKQVNVTMTTKSHHSSTATGPVFSSHQQTSHNVNRVSPSNQEAHNVSQPGNEGVSDTQPTLDW